MNKVVESNRHLIVEGTAALKEKPSFSPLQQGMIIEFPRSANHDAQQDACGYSARQRAAAFSDRLAGTWLISDLQSGSVKGKPMGKAKWWEVASASTIIAALALLAIFFGA